MMPEIALEGLSEASFAAVTGHRRRPCVFHFDLTDPEQYHPERLAALDPKVQVRVRSYAHDRKTTPRDQWTTYCSYLSIDMETYVRKVADGSAASEGLYLALFEVSGLAQGRPFQAHLDHLSRATGFQRSPGNDINLWLSPPSHFEGLHYDGDDGTLLQYHGRKTVTLFAPKHSRDLYPFPLIGGGLPGNFSRLDVAAMDASKYPKAVGIEAHALSVTLEPGQGVYIPAGWWHQVEASDNPEGVVSINRFWSTRHLPLLWERPRVAVSVLLAKGLAALQR